MPEEREYEHDDDGVVDLTVRDKPTEPKRFRIGGDVFHCAAVLPAAAKHSLTGFSRARQLGRPAAERVSLLGDFLDGVLLPESAQIFNQRIGNPENPITDEEVQAAVVYLIKEYAVGDAGAHPSEPSPSS